MPTTREGQIKELFKFPRDRKVKYLYRYRSIESPELNEIFTDRKIYLASPATFNDPFDCRPILTIYKSGPSRLSYLEKMAQERFPFADKNTLNQRIEEIERKLRSDPTYVERAYNGYVRNMGVYCLSQIPNDILMWSHYANGHKGICLEFDTTKYKRLFGQALNVDYSKTNEYPIVNIMDIDNPQEYHKALLTKSNHWAYEQEWRILKPIEEGGPGKHAFQAELLTGVILGALISPADKKKITDWVSNYLTKINMYRAKLNGTKYQLDIEAI